MILNNQTILIFGGTGFIGRHIVKELSKTGARINIYTRNPEAGLYLKTSGSVGQISLIKGDITNTKLIDKLARQSSIIINCVGMAHERRHDSFIDKHAKFPELLGKLSSKYGIHKVVHISSLGVDQNTKSKYAVTKLQGEESLSRNFPNATIIRPSVVFGIDDQFFNKLAALIKFLPFIPLIGTKNTKFQPVYVNDIAKSIYKIITTENEYDGKIYELGGPDTYNMKQIYEYIANTINIKRPMISVPYLIVKIFAVFFELFPNPTCTRDQIKLLQTHNITQEKAWTFFHLQIQPHKIEEIVPHYLNKYKSHCYHIPDTKP